ncbi:MAG: hypothetical protein M3Q49_15005, partial [Actinomycetota bacterium]|nr:hypothetical protein [Actinomycetota bacterium]
PVSSFTTGRTTAHVLPQRARQAPDEHEEIVTDRTEASFGKIERLHREHERRTTRAYVAYEPDG